MEDLDKNLLESDADGKTAKMSIKAPVKQFGARLNKRFKGAALVLIGVIVCFMIIGIMTAGNKNKDKGQAADGKLAMVGQTTPDVGSMEQRARQLSEEKKVTNRMDYSPSGFTAPKPAGNQGGKSAQEAYEQWQEEQYFKAAQAKLASAQSAATAPLSSSGSLNRANQTTTPANAIYQPGTAFSTGSENEAYRLANTMQNGGAGPNGVYSQAGNKEFVNEQKKTGSVYLNASLEESRGKHELFAGSTIPSVTITGINSDLPGTISAMVRQTVYDSKDGHTVLIPQGTKVSGAYSSGVAYGQRRVLVAWNHLIYPDGRTVDLQGMLGADEAGRSGLYDEVDNHYGRIFGSAVLISMLGVAAQLSQPQNSSILSSPSAGQLAGGAAASSMNTAATNVLNKNLNIAPTITIKPGMAFNIMVNKTMVLPAYR